jgi:large subunit ribosomal protein L6
MPAPPRISTTPLSLNFGKVKVGDAPERSIIIKNTGTSELAISSVDISGINFSEFSETNECSTIPAGEIENPRRTEAALVGTISAHVRNMIKGVSEGFIYKMKIVFVHFPTAVKVVGKEIHIENFVGERKPRIATILGNTKVTVKQDDVIIEGIDIDEVSQTAANIQSRAKIRNKDLRKFLDGIYVYSKE